MHGPPAGSLSRRLLGLGRVGVPVLVVVLGAGCAGAAPSRGPHRADGAARGVRVAATPSTTTWSPPSPPGPGPLAVDAAAWRGHGDLAFISRSRLSVLDDSGAVAAISGPPAGGVDSDPAWSADGAWLAFEHTSAPPGQETGLVNSSLWLVHAGSKVATEVAAAEVAHFRWAPTGGSVLAFETYSPTGLVDTLWLEHPSSPAVPVPGLHVVGGGLAWSPDGTHIAVVTGHGGWADGPGPLWVLQAVPASGGSPVTWFTSTHDSIDVAGWWPDGGGLLFWVDPGASESADGLTLYAQAAGGQPRALAETLMNNAWLAWGPDGHTVAVVAGGSRSIWGGAKHVETCVVPADTCTDVATAPGTVSLSPAWSPTGVLGFIDGSAAGPFGSDGRADYSEGWMARWNATNELWTETPGHPAQRASATSGVVAVQWNTGGTEVLTVRNDSLWLGPVTAASPRRVVGPLFASAAPSGYYGQVDWTSQFSWAR